MPSCARPHRKLSLLPRFDKNKGTSPRNVCVPAYLSSGIFCAVLSTLYAVAVDMSNPFDMCVAALLALPLPPS